MGSEAKTLTVHILGHEYKIRSTEDGDFVREVALYVDEMMHQIATKMTTGTPTQVAVLAALNIAEELYRERRNGFGNIDPNEVNERLGALARRVDEIINEAQDAEALSTSGSQSG